MTNTTAVIATATENKKRRAEQDPAVDEVKEEAAELFNWTDTLTRWLAKNGTRSLGSVVDLPTLFPDWTIADRQIHTLSAEVILRVMVVIYKDYGPPMSFSVYNSLRADYTAISHYALALSSVIPSDNFTPAAGKKEEAAQADDERYSRVVLLRNIARDLVPGMLKVGKRFVLLDEQLRSVDRAFLAWPVRYATPSGVLYNPEDEDDGIPASIDFYWDKDIDDDEKSMFDIGEGRDELELTSKDEEAQALLERVDGRAA